MKKTKYGSKSIVGSVGRYVVHINVRYIEAEAKIIGQCVSPYEELYGEPRFAHCRCPALYRMKNSMVNHALQTHSTKKKAWWGLVPCLSSVQLVEFRVVRTCR